MDTLIIAATLSLIALANSSPSPVIAGRRPAVSPQVKSVKLVANVTDPAVTRDSCASVRIGNRALWTCRDTEGWNYTSGQGELPVISNTASWTDFAADGTPKIQTGPVGADSDGSNLILLMYGGHPASLPAFYPILSDECSGYGVCDDGTRWAIWPNSRPMVTKRADGSVTAYSWIPKAHLDVLTSLNPEPIRTLYKVTYSPTSNKNKLPSVSVVDEEFWAEGDIGYGDYGNVVHDGIAYLYGQTDAEKGTVLAKVPADSVEDKSQYQYYVNGDWTSTMPGIDDTSAIIPNAGAGGQGTFYFSKYFNSFVWIGQTAMSGSADFMLTTAPTPEGLWIEPYLIYSGANGDSSIAGGYTLQAHPALLKSTHQNGIYLTWTQQYETTTYGGYVTPLVYVTWKQR